MPKSITEAGPATPGRTPARELTLAETDSVSGAAFNTVTGGCTNPLEDDNDCELDLDCE